MNPEWRVLGWRIAQRMGTIDYILVGARLVVLDIERHGKYARLHAEDHPSVEAATMVAAENMGRLESKGAVLVVAPVAHRLDSTGYGALMLLPDKKWQHFDTGAAIVKVIHRVIQQGALV